MNASDKYVYARTRQAPICIAQTRSWISGTCVVGTMAAGAKCARPGVSGTSVNRCTFAHLRARTRERTAK